jgi:hypothetical protein
MIQMKQDFSDNYLIMSSLSGLAFKETESINSKGNVTLIKWLPLVYFDLEFQMLQ